MNQLKWRGCPSLSMGKQSVGLFAQLTARTDFFGRRDLDVWEVFQMFLRSSQDFLGRVSEAAMK